MEGDGKRCDRGRIIRSGTTDGMQSPRRAGTRLEHTAAFRPSRQHAHGGRRGHKNIPGVRRGSLLMRWRTRLTACWQTGCCCRPDRHECPCLWSIGLEGTGGGRLALRCIAPRNYRRRTPRERALEAGLPMHVDFHAHDKRIFYSALLSVPSLTFAPPFPFALSLPYVLPVQVLHLTVRTVQSLSLF